MRQSEGDPVDTDVTMTIYIIGHSIYVMLQGGNELRGERGLNEFYSHLPTNSQRNNLNQSLLPFVTSARFRINTLCQPDPSLGVVYVVRTARPICLAEGRTSL